MARAFYIQNNFTSGELSPRLAYRSDLKQYKNGAKTLENMTVMPLGGVKSRAGTVYVAKVKDSSTDSRLIDFEFSVTQAYTIEAGDDYMRFYRNNGQIRLTAQDITGITKANPAVVTYSGSDTYANGDRVVLSGVVGMTEVNNVEYTVANVNTGANTFELSGVDSSAYTTYVSGGSIEEIYEIVSPYGDADIADIQYIQSADTMYIQHPSYAPRTLTRTAHTSWSIARADLRDGPFMAENTDGITLSLSGTAGSVTVTASSALFAATDTTGSGGTGDFDRHIRIQDRDASQAITGITKANPAVVTYSGGDNYSNGDTVYISGVGGMTEVNGKTFEIANVSAGSNTFELKDVNSTSYTTYTSGGTAQKIRSTWHWLKITGYTSSTVVTAEIQDDASFGSSGPFNTHKLGAFSSTTGFPSVASFHENRLVYANTSTEPDTIWGSVQDDYTNHAESTDDDGPFSFTLVSNQVNAIRWLSPQKTLRVGSSGSEFSVSGGSLQDAITPLNVRVTRETSLGSTDLDPILIENATLFFQRSGRKMREFVYSFEVDSFVAPDVSLTSEHITGTGVVSMAYQAEPDGIIWCARADGTLIGLTYLRGQDVIAWHKHPLGGTSAKVKSVATIPTASQDQLWAIVERTIDGASVKYVERLGDTFNNDTVTDAVFVDSSLSYTGEFPAVTLTPSATTGSVTLTAGSATFSASDVGRVVRSGTSKATITAYTSTTEVTALVNVDFADTSAIASGDWSLSTNTITGLNHLEGESVTLLTDGGAHPNVTVSGGSITLDSQYTTVHIGLGYTQIVESLSLEGGTPLGSSQGSRGRITEVSISLYESVGMDIGRSADLLRPIDFRRPSDVQNEGVPLFTGEKIIRPRGGWGDDITFMIKQTQPLPLTVLGYTAKMEVSDAP